MKVIVTGATGMVGKGVLLECLDHPGITEALSISRRSLDLKHPKLRELIHKDFSEFDSVIEQLSGYDACYCCMGVSVAGLNEEQYTKITYDFTISLLSVLASINQNMTVTYVSGQGTDSSEQGRSMWARVKGKTENKMLSLGFKGAYAFRPGIIIPQRGIKSSTKWYQYFYDYFMWLIKLMKWMAPNSVVNTTQIGHAMINVSSRPFNKSVVLPKDIITLSQRDQEG